ncbi:MAG: ABC transporter ATP-binding protein [Clostridia bacterium]|nr:ABC transporter ATP-binding protein [Clostridia bacterium]
MLKANHVSVLADGKAIVSDASLTLREHEWLMLLGPNGAGKSTLLSALSGTVPFTGEVEILGRKLERCKPSWLACHLGVMMQQTTLSAAFTVEEVTAMGRYARRRSLFSPADDGLAGAVDRALAATGLEHKRHQSVLTLSGGERQRLLLAQVFCQDPDILLLDEPANHLDLEHQKALLTLIDHWRRQQGKAVLSVVHDLSHARRFADRVLLMEDGQVVAAGNPEEVMTDENINRVWHFDAAGWLRELAGCWQQGDIQKA